MPCLLHYKKYGLTPVLASSFHRVVSSHLLETIYSHLCFFVKKYSYWFVFQLVL